MGRTARFLGRESQERTEGSLVPRPAERGERGGREGHFLDRQTRALVEEPLEEATRRA